MNRGNFSVFSWVNKNPLSCPLPNMAVGGGGWSYLIWIISDKGNKDSRGQSYRSHGLLVTTVGARQEANIILKLECRELNLHTALLFVCSTCSM